MTLVSEPLESLSPRERDVVDCLLKGGYGDADIARALVISPHTAHWLMGEIRRKLGVTSRVDIVRWALTTRSSTWLGHSIFCMCSSCRAVDVHVA